MTVRLRKFWMMFSILGVLGMMLWGCVNVGQDTPSVYGYDTTPILITNPDWGIIPLVNNFLNPAKQAEIPVMIPGVEITEIPTTVSLPTVGAKEAAIAQALGYSVEEDSDITKALIAGMNKLDGFVKNVPIRIPFSDKLDMDSLVFYDGQNVVPLGENKAANFFFLDITDTEDIKVVSQFNYPFNFEMNESYPYYLTLRLNETGFMASDFTPGHTYMVVVTGVNEDYGLKSLEGKTFMPDSFFSLFASETPYVAQDGSLRNNIISISPEDCAASKGEECTSDEIKAAVKAKIQELEGGRQITDYGLKIWEQLVKNNIEELKELANDEEKAQLEGIVRNRKEVIAAFHFTIVSNPFPTFMDATGVLLSPTGNAFKVSPIDNAAYESRDSDNVIINKADACLDEEITFAFSAVVPEINGDTINNNSVQVFKVEDGELTAIDTTIAFDSDSLKVTITADSNFAANTQYAVAVNNKITGGTKDRPAVDETYFGITRPDTPLISDTTWLSPHLDSRIDVLIAAALLNPGYDATLFEVNPTEETKADRETAVQAASLSTMKVLRVIEKMRQANSPFMPKLLDKGFVDEIEDVILFWTFTTGDGCNK